MAVMGEAAERFPKPAPEAAFRELKVYDGAGSPLRAAREDWAGARTRAGADGAWAEWVVGRRAEVDEWMEKRRDRVEWVAGWWHDFVRESDGAFLEWTPAPPVGVTAKVFGGWVFGFRSRNGDKMVEAARLWRLTGERKYGEWAAGQLDFYADNYERWPVQTSKSKSRLMHQSLDDAVMLVRLVRTAWTLEGFAGEARKKQWQEKLFYPMAALLDETFQRVHNIACWQRTAMAMAALYGKDEALWKRAIEGPFGIRRQMEGGVTSEWLWLEQSLLYNSYVVSALLPLFEQAGLAGRLGELKREAAIAENLMLGPAALRFVDGKLPTPADSTAGFRKWPEMGILVAARRVFPTRMGLRAAAGQRGWEALLDPVEEVTGSVEAPVVKAQSLETSRMAVIRGGAWQVYFHYGQVDASHAQAEALNWEAYHGLVDVTHDAGTVGYGSPLHQGYYKRGAAHNVPLVDGEGQAGWAMGELISFSGTQVEGMQAEYRAGVSARRRLAIEGEGLVDEVELKVKDGGERRLGVALHLQGVVALPPGFEADAGFGLPYWSEARTKEMASPVVLAARIGGGDYEVRVEAAGPMRVTHASVPDAPPGRREAVYFEVRGAGAVFKTTLRPVGR